MAELTCDMCGRVGVRGFKVYEPKEMTVHGHTFMTNRLVECVARRACNRGDEDAVVRIGGDKYGLAVQVVASRSLSAWPSCVIQAERTG